MACDLFPLDSTTLERTMAFSHNSNLMHAQDGSQHKFCWCKARSWCHIPPSTGQPATRRRHGRLRLSRPHPPPLSRGECRAGPGLANPTPEQHQSLPSLLTRASQGNPESSTAPDGCITTFPQEPPPAALHGSSTIKRGYCPTSMLI